MKKHVLIFVAALFGAAGATAQSVGGFQLGVKGGMNVSGYQGEDSELHRWENRYGGHVGVFVPIPITPKSFSIQPELLYSMKGANIYTSFSAGNEENSLEVMQHHLDIPIMAVFRARFFFLEAGPAFSLLLKASSKPDTEEFTDDMQRFAVGAAGGAGIMTEHGLTFGARYHGDFSKLLKETQQDERNYRNSVFQVYIGWLFGGRPGAELSTEPDDYRGG